MNLNNRSEIIKYFRQKNFNKVLKLAKKINSENQNNIEILKIIALSYIELENFLGAEKYFKGFTGTDGNNWVTKAVVLKKLLI